MLPAGLGIVCASQKALAAMKDAKCRRAYFEFGDHMKANATGYFPCTPVLMLLGAISGAEMAMNDIGIEVELGSGVAAAQAEFRGGAIAREQQKVAAE